MAITPEFLEEIKARLRVSDVVGRRVKLTRRGREFVGLSPFNQEKTPSFTVNDQKAFYHCFSSGKHGDVFSFLQEVEGLTFPEAVERLAEEVGLEVPRTSHRSKQEIEKKRSLMDVVELAAQYFEAGLQGDAGGTARRYLDGRKLAPKTWRQFRLGYAPEARTGLLSHLKAKDVPVDMMEQAGLLSKNDAGDVYDKFRNRIMFPIADTRGRVIGFGGRALEKGTNRPKYLNSPETPLFHKGRILYNHHLARQAAHDTQSILVAEGYMDVIGLAQAGIAHAVAPLGTALTGDQLSLLWRMAPEPVLCFDGDAAGTKAAYRAIDVALPMLRPGHSLRFAFLPEGQDPDDIVASGGAQAFHHVLSRALPLVEALWQREINAHDISTPEQRAGFEKRMSDLLSSIQEKRIRDHYRREFGQRWRALFPTSAPQERQSQRAAGGPIMGGGARRAMPRPGVGGAVPTPVPSAALLQSGLAKRASPIAYNENDSHKGPDHSCEMREAVLVITLLNHPELIHSVEEAFAAVELQSPQLDRLRRVILEVAVSSDGVDRGGLITHLHSHGVGKIAERYLGRNVLKSFRFVDSSCPAEDALKGWQQAYAIHDKVGRLEAELAEIIAELAAEPTEEKQAQWQSLRMELDLLQADVLGDDPR